MSGTYIQEWVWIDLILSWVCVCRSVPTQWLQTLRWWLIPERYKTILIIARRWYLHPQESLVPVGRWQLYLSYNYITNINFFIVKMYNNIHLLWNISFLKTIIWNIVNLIYESNIFLLIKYMSLSCIILYYYIYVLLYTI